MKKNYQEQIINYYQTSQWLYHIFCRDQMHHGFWDEKITTHYQAAIKENQAMINLGKIKAGDRVLDAGCGVGATAIYIAQKTGAEVTGG